MRIAAIGLASALVLWAGPSASTVSVARAQDGGEGGAEELPPPPPPPAPSDEEIPPPPPPAPGEEESPPPPPPAPGDEEEIPPPPPPGYQGGASAGYPPPAGGSHPGGGHYPSGPPAPAPSQPPPPEAQPGYRTHDGFYLRLSLGPGYLTTSAGADAADVTYYGAGIGLSVAIGGALAENLILYGTIYGLSAGDPTLEVDGEEDFVADSTVALGAGALGVGVAYYLMPVNVFLSASIGVGTTTMEGDWEDVIVDPAAGPRVRFFVGKEFWVSTNWGLGPALELFWGSSKGTLFFEDGAGVVTSERVTFQTFGGALHFSATYN